MNNVLLKIYLTKFINLISQSSPIYIENPSENNNFLIEDCIFNNNTALNSNGGILFIKNSFIIIKNCLFFQNMAQRGGSIYFYCLISDQNLCNFTLISDIFIMNSAIFDGGAYKWEFLKPNEINNTFINNTASYSKDYSSYFCKLGLEITSQQENSSIDTLFVSFAQNSPNNLICIFIRYF